MSKLVSQRMAGISSAVLAFQKASDTAVMERKAAEKMKGMLLESIQKEEAKIKILNDDLKISIGALEVLSKLSDDSINQSYKFIETSLNAALERIFAHCTRRIKLVESMRGGKNPQLALELTVENGIVRRLKEDSGHGLRQLVSLLSILCVICLSGARRFIVLDEVLNSLSRESREAVDDILHSFTQVGFQFLIAEHGFIAANSKVYRMELSNGVSSITSETLMGDEGFYLGKMDLDGGGDGEAEVE